MSEPHILVVDDDARLRTLLKRFLSENGFRVTVAQDARDARAALAGMAFDLIVLDVMMPGESGLEFAAALRGAVPILLLTALGEPDDRVAGLELGAEDYLAKPFEPRELVLRMRTILRRSMAPATARIVRFGDFLFDLDRELLTRNGEPVRLTPGEASLLAALAVRAGETVSREALTGPGGLPGNTRTVDVQVTRLRRKIEKDPRFPRHLQTVWGRGYVLRN